MSHYNRIPYDSLTIQDYLDALPSSNKIIKLINGRALTNCVTAGHDDENPSMLLYKGNKSVVFHCFSCAEVNKNARQEISNYFHEKFRGKYA